MSRGARRRRRSRRQLPVSFKIVAAAFVLICFLVVAEGLARFATPLVPAWQGEDNGGVVMVGHPERLWGMGPGVRLNGGTTATISTLGLREPIPGLPRPRGRERLMVLGDSTFFGHGVSDDQTLSAQLQARLVAQGVDVDVINGAIPGYSTEQTMLLLDDVGWDLQPTVLLIGNLWSDTNFDLFRDADLIRTRASFTSGLASRSAFMRLVAGWLDGFRGDRDARVVTWTRSSTYPTIGVRRVPLKSYARNLDRMVSDAQERGIGVAFMSPSNRDTVVDGRIHEQVWQGYFQTQQRLSACHGLPWVDTLPAFQAAVAQGATLDDLFIDEMHPTTRGHGVLAGAIIDALTAAGWPEARPLGKAEPCPIDDIEDPVPGGRSEDMNQLSPQSNLFPGMGTPGGPQAATVPAGERLPPGAWLVTGQVRATDWPVRVSLMDVEGRPLSSTVLSSSQAELELTVLNGLDRVAVHASDASGATDTVVATPEDAVVTLALGAAELPAEAALPDGP